MVCLTWSSAVWPKTAFLCRGIMWQTGSRRILWKRMMLEGMYLWVAFHSMILTAYYQMLISFIDVFSYAVFTWLVHQVKSVYVNFLSHCYIDTEVEVKEIYTSPSMWNLFENFLVDMGVVSISRFASVAVMSLVSCTLRLYMCFQFWPPTKRCGI